MIRWRVKGMLVNEVEIGSRPANRRFGWWKGLALTLGVGTALASLIPYTMILADVTNGVLIGNGLLGHLHQIPPPSLWVIPQTAAISLLVLPAMFAIVVVPITLSYTAARLAAKHIRLTLTRRIAIGVALGIAAESALSAFFSSHGSEWERLAAPHPSNVPLLVAAFTGGALGTLIRPRWLGIDHRV